MGKAVGGSVERGKKDGREGMLFQYVPPTILALTPSGSLLTKCFLGTFRDNKPFNEMALDELHTSTVAIFDLYNTAG